MNTFKIVSMLHNSEGNHRTFAYVKAVKEKRGNNKLPGKVFISMSFIFHEQKNIIPWYIPPDFHQRRLGPGRASTGHMVDILTPDTSLPCLAPIQEKLHMLER